MRCIGLGHSGGKVTLRPFQFEERRFQAALCAGTLRTIIQKEYSLFDRIESNLILRERSLVLGEETLILDDEPLRRVPRRSRTRTIFGQQRHPVGLRAFEIHSV